MSRTPIKKQLIGFIFLPLIYPSMPVDAITVHVPSGWPHPGITFTAPVFPLLANATVRCSVSSNNGTGTVSCPDVTDNLGNAQFTLLFHENACSTYEVRVWIDTHPESFTEITVIHSESCPTAPSSPSTVPSPVPEGTTSWPMKLIRISGDDQQGLPGEPLANPFVVQVLDQDNEPFEGATVRFSALKGGGSLSENTPKTDADGYARSTLTLGAALGTNKVQVNVEGISQVLVFSAEATLPPPIPTSLSIISGDNQEGLTGEPLTNPFIVQVHDQYGNPMAGVPVTFTGSETDGMLSATVVTTNANGEAQSTLTLGTEARTYTVEVSAEGITDIVTFSAVAELLEFNLSLSIGLNLIHLPLRVRAVDGMPTTIQSVSELYNQLGGADTVNFLITHDSQTQTWYGYFGDTDRGTTADRELTDQTGILANMTTPVSIRLGGDALGTDGRSTITLNQGINLVGLPLRDSRVTRVSDLFALDGIGGNTPVIILSDGGGFQSVGRVGDPGDIEITGGQSFILTAQQPATMTISGDAWTNVSGAAASPPVTRQGIEVGDTTPVLALKGSVVDEEVGLNKLNFRVTVKNLSTGRAVTGMTIDEGTGYRLTVVDIETERAATVGDILEISAQSLSPLVGVKPLWYTVTPEDVKQSLIQLPELVVYKIPAETELLRNYPNPFNPETWIPYRLAEDAFVTLTIYDGIGQVVRTLDVGHRIASAYENRSKAIYWDGRNHVGERVASGVYFYTLTVRSETRTDDYSATRKMLILK